MVQLIDRPTEQRFIHTGVSWDNFKAIQQGFADSPNIRLFYFAGELEILSTSPEHEIVKGNIGYLIEAYLLSQGVDFVATGSFSQEREAVASVQADESYCFGARKPIPDLAIEVVLTSGGPDKLQRYAALGVAEVWFWEAGSICVYQLHPSGYQQASESQFVKGIDLDRLAQCAEIESRSQAVRTFRLSS
ncbi:Uma2 family endonuclease [Nodosilinea sp. LEGE 07088]|uniref:Uma2 family endonuclease n=1 Tax=Nodosilinea sp. LEGE 07088 TaxID=2777968 RepID=UPI00188135D7|nr:Uma2 family endonuclease [Nodosilinea sp. LEGE 07088]MBE9138462.1 Uma2 family endonuclease [Nodosilinea sp. LEGE 07088]